MSHAPRNSQLTKNGQRLWFYLKFFIRIDVCIKRICLEFFNKVFYALGFEFERKGMKENKLWLHITDQTPKLGFLGVFPVAPNPTMSPYMASPMAGFKNYLKNISKNSKWRWFLPRASSWDHPCLVFVLNNFLVWTNVWDPLLNLPDNAESL